VICMCVMVVVVCMCVISAHADAKGIMQLLRQVRREIYCI